MFDFSELDRLNFEDGPHSYTLDGDELPSVTTIMNPLSNDKYSGISERVLEKAAGRGTAIHNSIENYLKFDIDDIEQEYRPYFDAFLKFWNTFNPECIRSELHVYHKLFRYSGTCDLLCKIDGKLILIDYKSTADIYEMTCRIQLEAYWQALASHGIMADEKWIVHLKKDGSYSIAKFPTKDSFAWRVFGSLKTVYDYLYSYKGNGRQVMILTKSA